MPHRVLMRDAAPRKVDVNNWKPWAGAFEPGEYWTHSIEEVREQFYSSRRIPKAILRGLHDVKRLVYSSCAGDAFEGTITVHALPEEWETLAHWCEALEDHGVQIEYQGEGLPSLTRRVMLALLRRKVARKGTSQEERQELHKRQKGKCELCGAALDRFAQADHTQPRGQSTTEEVNDLSNLRLLCVACHSSATSPVAQSLPQWDPLASWTAGRRFVDSPRPMQLITKLNALDERQQML